MTSTMFSLNKSLVYYLYPRYVSMNKGIELLYELIRSEMGVNPLSRDVFMFFNKKRDMVKALIYSLAYSCRLNGINTFEYFKDILNKFAMVNPNTNKEYLRKLLPDKWKK